MRWWSGPVSQHEGIRFKHNKQPPTFLLLPGLEGAGGVEGVGVKHCPVGRRSDRLAVQLHLLLRVSKLQGAGTLVRRGFLPVREADGGGEVDEALGQVGIRRLEAT